jgi:RHS repeat-associated protein
VGAAGDRNGLDTPDGGVAGAKHDLTEATGVAQIRPQAPVQASYAYTGDGLRATSTTTVDDTTTVIPTTGTHTYAWDTLAALPALLSDGAHDYLTGPDGQVIEQADVLGKASAGGTVFLHTDRLGSTRLLTNAGGQPVAAYSYTPTGVRVQDDGLALLPYAQGIPPQQARTAFGFAGSYTDPGTGWVYLQHRYEDPATDQLLSVDPAVGLTHQPYSYAADDPIDLTDPTGATPGVGGCDLATWIQDHSPHAADAESLIEQLAVGMQESSRNFWETENMLSSTGPDQQLCYGYKGCDEAYVYAFNHPDDIQGIQKIAATYCLYNPQDCHRSAEVESIWSKDFDAIPYALAAGLASASADATDDPAPTGVAAEDAGVDLWDGWRGTNMSDEDSFNYHYAKHGAGRTPAQYAQDAKSWAANPTGVGTPVKLADGTMGMRYRTPGGGPGGILDSNGNIVTFWYQ